MKILATCATGGIGSVRVPALAPAGHEIAVLSRSAEKARASFSEVEAAQSSTALGQIVYMGGQKPEGMSTVPTVAPVLFIEPALTQSAKPETILRPSTFIQNDLGFSQAIQAGVYPAPFGDVGIARVDLVDVAAAAAAFVGAGAQ